MKTPFFAPPRGVLLRTLTMLMIALGAVLPLCAALDLTVSASFVLCVCALIALCAGLLDCMPKLRVLFYPLLALCIAAIAFFYMDRAQAALNALILFVSGQPLALAAYSRAIALLLCLLFSAMAAALSDSEHSFFPLALLSAMLLLAISLLGAQVPPLSLLPLAAALILTCRVPGASALRVLPSAALILLFAFGAAHLAPPSSPALRDFAQEVKQAIGDYLFFTDARATFSLSSTGWQPLGAERLGGPASPTDAPVMQVYTSGRTLLRGTVKNTYTGAGWTDTTAQHRYLFVNPRFLSLRTNLFDQTRPNQALRDQVLVYEPMIVSMRADSVSTLFLTQRFTSPAGEDVVAYFSPSTEVFATRSLETDMRYTFTGSRLSGASENVRHAVLAAQADPDPYADTVRERYLALPDMLDDQVVFLAQQVTSNAANDFDRASTLCTFLQKNFTYTLNQNVPPQNQDFVSWFLLEEQRGYCTSFASALAVMGRAVGLPTRYVEGYSAVPDDDNIARVTQENAHAWTEIYFEGFGWLPFDATPGTGFIPDGHEGDGDDAPDGPSDHEDPDGDGESPDPSLPTPSPEPSNTPTPTPQPTAAPTPSASPTPEHDDPQVTPTPEITPQPTPSPSQPPVITPQPSTPPSDPPQRDFPWPVAAILLLLLLAFAIAIRLYTAAPEHVAMRHRRANDALLIWYRVCTEALICLGIPPQSGEAPASYMARAEQQLGGSPTLQNLGKALCISRYSAHKLSRTQLDKAKKTYRALLARMKPHQRLRLYLRRIVRGTKL